MAETIDTRIVHHPGEQDLACAARILQKGGLVAFPTETVYGLGASALDAEAAKKIYQAKGRPSDNPLIIHLASAADAWRYAKIPSCFEKLAECFMPGPLTVIVPKKDIIPDPVTGGLSTVAIRVPAHPLAHRLLQLAEIPIAAPSANRSGRPSCTTAGHVMEDMNGRVDMILDGGDCQFGVESTILLPVGNREVKLLRPGAVTVEMLKENGFDVSLDKAVTQRLQENEHPLAPGMKYRHYAPQAQLILLSGSQEAVVSYMQEKVGEAGTAFILFEELLDCLPQGRSVSLGKQSDAKEQAHRLFSVLRMFDAHPEIDTIYAQLPPKDDISLALYNRMLKASGYTVVSCV